jgi:hypothetical protein
LDRSRTLINSIHYIFQSTIFLEFQPSTLQIARGQADRYSPGLNTEILRKYLIFHFALSLYVFISIFHKSDFVCISCIWTLQSDQPCHIPHSILLNSVDKFSKLQEMVRPSIASNDQCHQFLCSNRGEQSILTVALILPSLPRSI